MPRATINNVALRRLFHDDPPPAPHRHSPGSSSQAPPDGHPPKASARPPQDVKVKEEPQPFRRALSIVRGLVIDVDSPPKKHLKTVKTEITETEPSINSAADLPSSSHLPANEPHSEVSHEARPVSPTSPCREDHRNQEAHDALAANQSAPAPSPASLGSSMDIESIHDPMEDLEHEEQNELSLSQELSAISEQELSEDQT